MKRRILANIDRLTQTMDERGLDAVIARSGVNFTYLTGVAYPGTLGRHLDLAESPRPVFAVWPRSGPPFVLLNPLADQLTRRDSWIEEVVVYTSYVDEPLAMLADLLHEHGLADGRIGFEESYFSVPQLTELKRLMPQASFTDCTAMMDCVRWIKTRDEVALIKRAAHLLDGAFLEVYASMREGETERSAHARMVASCMQRGASFAHGWMASSRNKVPAGGQSDLAFARGDIVRTDYVAYLDGYPGHQSRNAVLGEPTPEQITAFARMRDIYLSTAERCRPGVSCGDVFAFIEQRITATGFPCKVTLGGHSVGSWWHQQEPFIARGATTPLESGMVIALEPFIDEWITQDMFVITDDGAQLLSDTFKTDTLYRIPL